MTKSPSRAKSSRQGQRLAAPSPLLRLKNELFYSRNWLSTTIEEFVGAVDSYIRWYNEARIKCRWASAVPSLYGVGHPIHVNGDPRVPAARPVATGDPADS